MTILAFIMANWMAVLAAINGVLVALIAVFVLIPGPEPERTLQKIVDFIAKISR